ncbi:MAG TPA: CorA family divalent cation transporter [Ideonella sp.]|jgi:hypothetical protein|nr:CorA family divalent cation transporter [Ideonella sp.]
MLDQRPDLSALPHAGDGRAGPVVQHLREVLLWPLRLMPLRGDEDGDPPWQRLRDLGDRSPWREQVDEYTGDPSQFHERHYNEFVTFLPYVQRFLYGEGRAAREKGDSAEEGSPMRVFRRRDVARVRVWLDAEGEPIELRVVHVDLYFFFDVDVVMLNVEFEADTLPLAVAQELLYRTGRAYPPGWDDAGRPRHCLQGAEWLAADGRVLARSDAQARELFLAHVAEHRSPRIASHWAWLLEPLVPDHSGAQGSLRYRQIEYYRMPMMAYLALDDPSALTRADFIRLGLVTSADAAAGNAPAEAGLPYAEHHLSDFESRFCYDRFWSPRGDAPYTRYLCSGRSLVVVGRADAHFFRCADRGVLAQFRHPHFMLFLIAHFQKAALLMFSDRLAEALKRLNVRDASSIKRFKREIRSCFEGFLRFTHRYWFHEVAEQAQARALFQLLAGHLRVDTLYADVKQRIAEMNDYLDADSLRRQANTVVRLTVVTMFGLIGTVTTGFLGMNLLAEADAPMSRRFWLFTGVFLLTTALTFYTIAKSKRLSDFLDVLSDERISLWQKAKVWLSVWGPEKD